MSYAFEGYITSIRAEHSNGIQFTIKGKQTVYHEGIEYNVWTNHIDLKNSTHKEARLIKTDVLYQLPTGIPNDILATLIGKKIELASGDPKNDNSSTVDAIKISTEY